MADFAPRDTSGNFRFSDPTYPGGRQDNGYHRRNLILWEVPHLGSGRYIEMYVNPQSISSNNKKIQSLKRTKGGFILQYWGEELETLQLDCVSGDGGIEVVNAMEDVYRSEQLAITALLEEVSKLGSPSDFTKRRQPLAPLSASIIMWYMGQGKRGYFTDMSITEAAQNPGIFNFRLGFTVVEIIGKRLNFMPWHRKPWSTTETPNIGPGGRVVTGGYAGDSETRLGRLNSPIGFIPWARDTEGEITIDTSSSTQPQWTENIFNDPKRPSLRDMRLFSPIGPKGSPPTITTGETQLALKNNAAAAGTLEGQPTTNTKSTGAPLPSKQDIPSAPASGFDIKLS